MPTHPSAPAGAAARPPFRSGAGWRRPQDTTAQLTRLSSRLDLLLRDVSMGGHSHRTYERCVAEGEAIAAGIRAAFREPTPSTPAKPVNPPLAVRRGQAWF